MESALMISPPAISASRMPTAVLPIPVGPQMTMTFGLSISDTIFEIKHLNPDLPKTEIQKELITKTRNLESAKFFISLVFS
jgi:hypothetical protein